MKLKNAAVFLFLLTVISSPTEAQRRGGGGSAQRSGGAQVNRSATSASIQSSQSVNRNVNANGDMNRNVNRDVDRNVDVNRDVDVNRNVDVGDNYDRWGHPVARGVAVGTTAALAYGATVAMLPSSGCSTVVVNGIGYSQCGSTWYEPYYGGTDVEYVVVAPPQ